jgi:hypothetical protein
MTGAFPLFRRRTLSAMPRVVLVVTALITTFLAPVSAFAQCEGWHVGPISVGPDGTNGTVNAIVSWDPDGAGSLGTVLVVGGAFTTIEGVSVTNLAMRDPATGGWVPVGPNGQAPPVSALCVWNGKLVVGSGGDNNVGTFDQTVRTWDGSAWASLGTTNTGSIYTMAVYNGDLYVGGSFWTTNTSDTNPAQSVARWNPGVQKWDELNANTADGSVLTMCVWNSELVIGGGFNLIGGNTFHGCARWNGSSWLSMNLSNGAVVQALQPYFGGLYVGGGGLNDGTTNMGGLGRWSGSSWSSAGGTFGGAVYCMTVFNGRLIVSGLFNSGGASPNITQYDGSYTGMGAGTSTYITTMFPYGGLLYVGGSLTTVDAHPANHMAKWNGSGWATVGGGSISSVLSMTNFLGGLVLGGGFSQSTTGGQTAVDIGSWNGTTLSPFGSGFDNQVNALKSFKYAGATGPYELVAGGYFTHSGGLAVNRIARWDVDPLGGINPGWQAMGPGMDGAVLAIERFNNATYAGGNFFYSGTTALASIGRWNPTTSQWDNIGGANGVVYALKSYGGYLYAGGSFTQIGSVSTGGLARYNGTSWSNVGGFFLGSVYALEAWNNLLVIGGDYAGINSSPDLAWYNGSGYGTFSTGGSNSAINALHGNGSRLYVGGTFTSLGGIAANRVGYWDGSWHAMTTGADNSVYALGALGDEEHVGGAFAFAGTLGSPRWALYSPTGVPWFTQQPFNQSVSTGANVSFTAHLASGYATPSLQWYRKGFPAADGPTGTGSTIAGSNNETLQLSNVSVADAGAYLLVITNACGTDSSNQVTLTVDGVTAAPTQAPVTMDVIESFGPNPSRGAAHVAFALARDAHVQMTVHDIAGRIVRRMDAGALPSGRHALEWDGRDDGGQAVHTGLYLVRLRAGDRMLGTRRLVIER